MQYWKNRVALITGVDGFVASHIAKRIADAGAHVIGVVRSIKAKRQSYLDMLGIRDKITLVNGSIIDSNLMSDLAASYSVTDVFHLAAHSIVQSATQSPYTTFDVNVRGTYAVLDACRDIKTLTSIVVASTDKSYGAHDQLPYREDFALQAKNVYDASKACADIIARSYAYNFDMPIAVTRCCNVAGFDLNLTRIIPRTIINVLSGQNPVLYSDILNFTREFIHVDDVVDGYLKIAENISAGKGKAYNIASGSDKNIIRIPVVVEKIIQLMGSDIKPKIIEKNNANFKEIPQQYLDTSLMKKDFGWQAKIEMDELLTKCIASYKEYLKHQD